jgi:flagellar hook protein FlgE
MAINSITGPSLLGIQKGLQGIRRVASEIAGATQSPETRPTDLSRAMVEIKQHANQAKASAKALKTADDMLGTLFDERA